MCVCVQGNHFLHLGRLLLLLDEMNMSKDVMI